MADDVEFFEGPAAWRRWLEEHHATATSQWVGFHKKGTGRPSLTWPESVDEALCFGWIDGLRKGIDDEAYRIRFSPRKPGSIWSAVNTRRMAELEALGRMHPAGRAAFAARKPEKSGIYAYEQRAAAHFEPVEEAVFRARPTAWADWERRPSHYRKGATWWVVSAKKAETRARRLATLIECCEAGRNIPPYTPTKG